MNWDAYMHRDVLTTQTTRDIIEQLYDYDSFMIEDKCCVYDDIAKLARAENTDKHNELLQTSRDYIIRFSAWRYYIKSEYIKDIVMSQFTKIMLADAEDKVSIFTRIKIITGEPCEMCKTAVAEVFELAKKRKLGFRWIWV